MSKKITYESALNELQNIVAEIEGEEIGIDELSKKVKRAAELLKTCQQKLRQTEEDVNEILAQFDEK
ncbi:MAG: exodeoxyribonuclease VII small subunit [Bacteroidetes bacterium 4572_77]|nr:MAG: exodeoxyribonuclease VII small subunit [Bacteroidetes bacterium 4572_77]